MAANKEEQDLMEKKLVQELDFASNAVDEALKHYAVAQKAFTDAQIKADEAWANRNEAWKKLCDFRNSVYS